MLNTGFAAANLRDPPETNQMTTERKEDIFRWETDSNMSRRMTGAEFSSSLDIRNPPTLPTPIPSSYGSYPASSVTSSSQGKDAQATVQHDHVERGISSHPLFASLPRRSSTPAPAEEQPEWQNDLEDSGHELMSAVDGMHRAYPIRILVVGRVSVSPSVSDSIHSVRSLVSADPI